MDGAVTLRELDPAGDRGTIEALWRSALAPAWPPLPAGIASVKVGMVAEVRGVACGMVALAPAGGIPLLLVDPAHQRRGVGTMLHDAALRRLRELGTGTVRLGHGGDNYIWPGVPDDLPAAVEFFAARGWRWDEPVADVVRDLEGYRTPAGVHERAAEAGIRLGMAGEPDRADVLAFEAAAFPNWLYWFERGQTPVLVARDLDGRVAGSLLFSGPDPGALLAPMLGAASGTIGCVGVAEHARGRGVGTAMVARASELLRDAGTRACHIGWTVRERFYGRLGYVRWRRYRMSRRQLPDATLTC